MAAMKAIKLVGKALWTLARQGRCWLKAKVDGNEAAAAVALLRLDRELAAIQKQLS